MGSDNSRGNFALGTNWVWTQRRRKNEPLEAYTRQDRVGEAR
jgi:hypothetical protein